MVGDTSRRGVHSYLSLEPPAKGVAVGAQLHRPLLAPTAAFLHLGRAGHRMPALMGDERDEEWPPEPISIAEKLDPAGGEIFLVAFPPPQTGITARLLDEASEVILVNTPHAPCIIFFDVQVAKSAYPPAEPRPISRVPLHGSKDPRNSTPYPRYLNRAAKSQDRAGGHPNLIPSMRRGVNGRGGAARRLRNGNLDSRQERRMKLAQLHSDGYSDERDRKIHQKADAHRHPSRGGTQVVGTLHRRR